MLLKATKIASVMKTKSGADREMLPTTTLSILGVKARCNFSAD